MAVYWTRSRTKGLTPVCDSDRISVQVHRARPIVTAESAFAPGYPRWRHAYTASPLVTTPASVRRSTWNTPGSSTEEHLFVSCK